MADQDTNPFQSSRAPATTVRRITVAGAGGFLTTFAVLLVLLHVYEMAPGQRGVVRVPLWRFYAHELSRQLGSSWAPTGPGSSGPGFWQMLLQHLLVSALCGALCAGIALGLRRMRAARVSQTGPN